tara:strand:+ start:2707 stop:3018 length:312 start_codon:yes stop_codon:yes gene_type:complete
MKPKVIHISHEESYYCDYILEDSWGAKYLEDSFARNLPLCVDCLNAYELKNGIKMKDRLVDFWNNKEVREEVKKEVDENLNSMINHTETKVKVVKTLREYLET